jgi:hypothetical protein
MHQRMQRLMSCYTKRNAIAALVGAMIGVTWNLARTGLDGAGGYTGILLLIVVGQVIYPVTGDGVAYLFYRAWRRVPELIDATPDWVFAFAPIFGRTLVHLCLGVLVLVMIWRITGVTPMSVMSDLKANFEASRDAAH